MNTETLSGLGPEVFKAVEPEVIPNEVGEYEDEDVNEGDECEEYDKYDDGGYWEKVDDYIADLDSLIERIEFAQSSDNSELAKKIAAVTPVEDVNDVLVDTNAGMDDAEYDAEDSYKKYLNVVKSVFNNSKDGKSFFTYKLENFVTDTLFEDKSVLKNVKTSLFESLKKSLPTIKVTFNDIQRYLNGDGYVIAKRLLTDVISKGGHKKHYYTITLNKGKTKLIFNLKMLRRIKDLIEKQSRLTPSNNLTLCAVVGKDVDKYLFKLNYIFGITAPFSIFNYGSIAICTATNLNTNQVKSIPASPMYRSIKDIIALPTTDEWNALQSPVKNTMYSYVSNWVALNKSNIAAKVPTQLGLTISGPKGCGKTSLAKQIAYNLGLTVRFVDYSDIECSLSNLSPYTMVIFDDADCAFGVRAQQVQGAVNRSVLTQSNAMTSRKELIEFNKLLGFIQGQVAHVGIVFVLITNYKDSIDTALTSRFGREFTMGYFSKEETELYCRNNKVPFKLIDQLFKSEYPICPRQLEATCKEYHSRVFAKKNQLYAEFICEKITKKEKQEGEI